MSNEYKDWIRDRVYYAVPEDILLHLLESAVIFDALESGGVDDWEWYGDSCQDYLKESYPNCRDFNEAAKLELKDYEFDKIAVSNKYKIKE